MPISCITSHPLSLLASIGSSIVGEIDCVGGLRNATIRCGCICAASDSSGALGPFTPVDPEKGLTLIKPSPQYDADLGVISGVSASSVNEPAFSNDAEHKNNNNYI